MKRYSGQAIAIIMVVLVVATVVGASLYSRVVTNRQTAFEASETKRALEQSDSVLDFLISSDLLAVQNLLSTCIQEKKEEGGCIFESISDFAAYIVTGDFDIDPTLLYSDEWCEDPEDEKNSSRVIIEYAGINDINNEYTVGEVKAINLQGASVPSDCVIDFKFQNTGSGAAVFTVKEVYMDSNGNVKPYELDLPVDIDDMRLYCIGNESECAASVAPTQSIYKRIPNPGTLDFEIGAMKRDPYNLIELRILPLKNSIIITSQPSVSCIELLSDYKVVTEITCSGQLGPKQVVFPNQRSMGYHPLFDYTIYNADGILKPS